MAAITTAKTVINFADVAGNVAKIEVPIANVQEMEQLTSETFVALLPLATATVVDDNDNDTGKTLVQTSAQTNVTRIKSAYTDTTTREYVSGYEPLMDVIDDED